MKLSELLGNFLNALPATDPEITGLTLDSRQVVPGDLFVACKGETYDGRDYINDAIARGAVAVLVENDPILKSVPVVGIENLSNKLGWIAAHFYGQPSRHMKMIGVTGTAGKTSCTYWLSEALQPSGLIGTLGSGINGQMHIGTHTTPDAITLQKTLADFHQQGIKRVAMEVSSHALVQGRVTGIEFDIGVFTNLSREHLDYHGDMESYAAAKRRLFETAGLRYAVANAEDHYGQEILKMRPDVLQAFGYCIGKVPAKLKNIPMVIADSVKLDMRGIKARINTPWGEGILESPFLGRFNLSNLLAILTVLGIMGMPLDEALAKIAVLPSVPGRMQMLGGDETTPLVIVDYAHKPDALEQVLKTLRGICQGKLWCVFGCGGDRDRGKRALMGGIAEKYADQIVLTDDNPRTESPAFIVSEILQGMSPGTTAVIEHDRRRAIEHALSCAHPGDIVLIAGKGHEICQYVGDQKLPFNDILEVKQFLAAKNETL